MPGRRPQRQLGIGLILILTVASPSAAREQVIVVEPGVVKTIPGPKKPTSRSRRKPRVGARKTDYLLFTARVEPFRSGTERGGRKRRASGKDEAETPEDFEKETERVETVEVERKQNTIRITAEDEAAGQLFRLLAVFTVRTAQYKKISRDEFGKKIQPYTTWIDLPDRETTTQYTLAVALGTLPRALVPAGGEMTIALPETVRRLSVTNRRRPEAEVALSDDNRLRIAGRRLGDAEFDLKYELAGRRLEATLPVRVIKEPKLISLTVGVNRRDDVGFDEIDGLFGLENGQLVRVDHIDKPGVAQIASDAFRVQVRGLKPGTAHAVLAYTGTKPGRGRRRERCQAQVPLIITVK